MQNESPRSLLELLLHRPQSPKRSITIREHLLSNMSSTCPHQPCCPPWPIFSPQMIRHQLSTSSSSPAETSPGFARRSSPTGTKLRHGG
ncbi:hypothetical protein EJB05_15199, partial [Eragrostis curvula]